MIPRLLRQLEESRREFTWRELCYRLVPCATVQRWRSRQQAGQPLLHAPGPKKTSPLNEQEVRARIVQLEHRPRRTAGTTGLQAELADAISRRRFQELVAEERQHRCDAMKRITWLLPGSVWSIDTTQYGPEKLKITPLRDLASKYQLPTPLVATAEDGAQIALYLERMFRQHGAPMFLKRDLGSPLNSLAVDEVLERHWVLPLNSPPGYPKYNGAMERSMRDLHSALDRQRWQALQLPAAVELELVTHQLNHRRLRSLQHRTPCQVFHDPQRRLQLHGASRQRIFREVLEQFWHYIQCMPVRNRLTRTAAWRLVVESWLRRQGWISVSEKTNNHVSTNSKPFFSQN
jgi:hypothetical protein